jgi:hypothetical protein
MECEKCARSVLAIGSAPVPKSAEAMVSILVIGVAPAADLDSPVGFRIDVGGEQEITDAPLKPVIHFMGQVATIFQNRIPVIGVAELDDTLRRDEGVSRGRRNGKDLDGQRPRDRRPGRAPQPNRYAMPINAARGSAPCGRSCTSALRESLAPGSRRSLHQAD